MKVGDNINVEFKKGTKGFGRVEECELIEDNLKLSLRVGEDSYAKFQSLKGVRHFYITNPYVKEPHVGFEKGPACNEISGTELIVSGNIKVKLPNGVEISIAAEDINEVEKNNSPLSN